MSMNECDVGSIRYALDKLQNVCDAADDDVKEVVSGAILSMSEAVNSALDQFKSTCTSEPKIDPRLSFLRGEYLFNFGDVIMASSDGVYWYKKYEKCADQEGV